MHLLDLRSLSPERQSAPSTLRSEECKPGRVAYRSSTEKDARSYRSANG